MEHSSGKRVCSYRKRWALTTDDLAHKAGMDLETLTQIESGTIRLSEADSQRLAEALCISAEWLMTGRGDAIGLHNMTPDEQIKEQTGPGSEGLPGFVVMRGGPWYRDDRGRWRVEADTDCKTP